MSSDNNEVIAVTRLWLEKMVIGLNLCPFAKAVYVKNKIRYVVTEVSNKKALKNLLEKELYLLKETPIEEVETTLIIHPHVLQDFFEYNNFLTVVDNLLVDLDMNGDIQIASFHPQYQFSDVDDDDITNYTNRSPYPILHLLREQSVDRAVEAFPNVEDIYLANIETMRILGYEGLKSLELPQIFYSDNKE